MRVIWTTEANESYTNLLNFLYEKYSVDAVIQLDDKVMDLLEKLKKKELLCPQSKSYAGLRKCVVTKRTSLIYRTDGKVLEIILFVDNRSDHGF